MVAKLAEPIVDVPDFEDILRDGNGPVIIPPGQVNQTVPGDMDTDIMIGEIASLDQFVKRVKVLKEEIKKRMMEDKSERVIDEASGWRGRLTPSFIDIWDLDRLEGAVSPETFVKVTKRTVDSKAMDKAREDGLVPMVDLRERGIVERTIRSVALYVEPHKVKK